MNALELYQVGRWMMKVAEEAMRPENVPVTPPGARLVMSDAYQNPDSSIGGIAARTALPQSFVSEVVAQMRELGIFETRVDPTDRRRTLVRISDAVPRTIVNDVGTVQIDNRLIEELGHDGGLKDKRLIETLEIVAARLRVMRKESGDLRPL